MSFIMTCKQLVLCQELIDIIIDHAHDDRDVLLNCSLASRIFLPSTRLYLFERLHLQASQWDDFFNLLRLPLATITHVQFITLDFESRSHPDPLSVITYLHGLRLYSIALVNMHVRNQNYLDHEFTGFDDLRRLHITHGYFTNPIQMFDIISKFTGVEHLCLGPLDFTHNIVAPSTNDHPHKSTAHFWKIFEQHDLAAHFEILVWLTQQPDLSALQTIALTGLEAQDFDVVGKLLRALGSQLKYLELQLPGTRIENFQNHLDLSFNDNLQCIHIILPDFVGAMRRILATQCQALTAFACILSRVMSPLLRKIVLSEGPEVEWAVMDMVLLPGVVSALKGRQFADVQSVVFPPLHDWGFEDEQQYLRTELSDWDHSGVLVFKEDHGYLARLEYSDE